MKNPFRVDPTRSIVLRKRAEVDLSKRFRKLTREIENLLVVEDAFGLKVPRRTTVFNTRWVGLSQAQKLANFLQWYGTQIQNITPTEAQSSFFNKYIKEGYEKGYTRSYDDVNKTAIKQESEFFRGSRAQFLNDAFNQPVAIEKVEILTSRAFNELKGVTNNMAQTMSRILAQSLVEGTSPRRIASQLKNQLGISLRRAKTIARTEIIRAHSEGQLDAMEKLGVQELGVMVEWDTAGDDLVCPLCSSLSGVILKTSEARGLIPRHPNCRCAYVPANVGEDKRGQTRTPSAIRTAISKSLKASSPKKSLKTIKQETEWPGSKVSISKSRPKSKLEE